METLKNKLRKKYFIMMPSEIMRRRIIIADTDAFGKYSGIYHRNAIKNKNDEADASPYEKQINQL